MKNIHHLHGFNMHVLPSDFKVKVYFNHLLPKVLSDLFVGVLSVVTFRHVLRSVDLLFI